MYFLSNLLNQDIRISITNVRIFYVQIQIILNRFVKISFYHHFKNKKFIKLSKPSILPNLHLKLINFSFIFATWKIL